MVRRCGFVALLAPLGLFGCADDPYGVDTTAVGPVREAEAGGGGGHVFTPVELSDREVLEALYHATDGPNWKRSDNWLTDAPLREWHGIGSEWHDGEERVDRLLLGNNGLSGVLPAVIGQLDRLTHLHLQDQGNNRGLSGPIPASIGKLRRLESLNLTENALSGSIPASIGALNRLRHLYLQDNDLSGRIPSEIGNLAALETLRLLYNDLSGPIPPEIGNLAVLEALLLDTNDLSGPIPAEIGNLAALRELQLEGNDLSGPVPLELANLDPAVRVTLYGNVRLCAPDDAQFRAWLLERRLYLYACQPDPDIRLLPRVLIREDGNGLSLALPDDLQSPSGVTVSDPTVVAATVADGWLKIEPRSIGEANVEVVPAGAGLPTVVGVAVRAAVGTFGIDIVMDQPAPLGYEAGMLEAADWWSYMLDGTERPDRRVVFPGIPQHGGDLCNVGGVAALVDDLLVLGKVADITGPAAFGGPCPPHDGDVPYHGGVNARPFFSGNPGMLRHEIGHVLGLSALPGVFPDLTVTAEDGRRYFIGPLAVEAYRAGGGDPTLPGVPIVGAHWDAQVELMGSGGYRPPHIPEPNGLSLAALVDAGLVVDMSKATPWRKPPPGGYRRGG